MKSKKINRLLCAGITSTMVLTNFNFSIYAADKVSVPFPIVSFEDGESDINYTGGVEGANYVKTEVVESKNATDGQKALKATYYKGSWPGINFYPKDGEVWNFTDKAWCFDVTNTTGKSLKLNIKFDSDTKSASGSSSTYIATIAAGKTMTINVSSDGGSVNLGMLENPPSSAGTAAKFGWGNKTLDYSTINHIAVIINGNTEENELIFDNFHMIENPNKNYKELYKDLSDEYGQYTKNNNSNKITGDNDFAVKKAEEEALLKEQLKVTNERNISKYYGLKDESLRQKATGHFYAAKIDNKWMMVDPEGYPYYSTGIDLIRTEGALTWITGRDFMFKNIPSESGSLGDHYAPVSNCARSPFDLKEGVAFNFYTANLERKYGDNWLQEWANNAITRSKAWGFSSMGCWADAELYYGKGEENQFPYVAHALVNQNHAKIIDGSIAISDPFDPGFKTFAEEQMQALKDKGVNDDPYCSGIYVDNEISWGKGSDQSTKYAVVNAVFKKDASEDSSYAKRAFISFLKEKYTSIEELNKAWDTQLSGWNVLEAPYTASMLDADKSACLTLIGEQYYRTVSESVKKYLPNIMYLGSRLAVWGSGTEIIQACAKYADVVSFNCYRTDVNQDFMQFGTYDKPVIIGEFHFNATDNNNFTSGLVPVGTQQGRGDAYTKYMTSAYNNDYLVGAHWFQYYDQPLLGRAWDGENSNCGFVDVTDQPYKELVSAAKAINEKAYDIKFNINDEDQNQKKADAVIEKINAIGNVTLESKDAINIARSSYEALTDEQKKLISYDIKELFINAQNKYVNLLKEEAQKVKAEAEKAKEEAQKAKEEAEKAKAESDKLKAEAEKAKEEAEKAKAESDKLKAEAQKAKEEADKATAQADKTKAEAKKAIEEAEKANIEAKKAKEEAEKILEDVKNSLIPKQINKTYVHNYGRNAFKVGWAKQSGVSGYRVYKSTSRNGKYERVATIKGDSNTTFIDKDVKSGTTYYYKVRAYKTVSGKMIFGEYSGIKYRKR